ncbi:MAG: hypothetical protein U1D55_15900 [Phycisphaerae bacterium]
MPTGPTNRRWRTLPPILAPLLIAGCVGGGKPLFGNAPTAPQISEWSYRGRPGAQLVTEHYELHTTLRDAELIDAVARMLEVAFAHYQSLVPQAHTPEARMKVYLFATRSDWADFTGRLTGPRAPTFLQIRNGGYVENGIAVMEFAAHHTTFPLLAHEGFHQYLFHCVRGNAPAWLNEGLAVSCEGQRWGRFDLLEFTPWENPLRHNALAEAIVRNEMTPLPQLLRIDAGDVIGGGTRRVGEYYAQLWGLMWFLRDSASGAYGEGFSRLLAKLGSEDLEQYAEAAHIWSGKSDFSFGESLFRSFVTTDFDEFERKWHAFLKEKVLSSKR